MSAIQKHSETGLAALTESERNILRTQVFPRATDAHLELYVHDCVRYGVHPLDRLIHPQVHSTKDGPKYTPITSIDLFRSRAEETGDYGGSDEPVFTGEPKTPAFTAKVTIWKHVHGQFRAFTGVTRWSEYCPPAGRDQMWQKMPHTMLAKTAEAQALRKAFPAKLRGLYVREEMDQASGAEVIDATPRGTRPKMLAGKVRTLDDVAGDEFVSEVVTPEQQMRGAIAAAAEVGFVPEDGSVDPMADREEIYVLLETAGDEVSLRDVAEKIKALPAGDRTPFWQIFANNCKGAGLDPAKVSGVSGKRGK